MWRQEKGREMRMNVVGEERGIRERGGRNHEEKDGGGGREDGGMPDGETERETGGE